MKNKSAPFPKPPPKNGEYHGAARARALAFLGIATVPVAPVGVPPTESPYPGENMRPCMSQSAPPPAVSLFNILNSPFSRAPAGRFFTRQHDLSSSSPVGTRRSAGVLACEFWRRPAASPTMGRTGPVREPAAEDGRATSPVRQAGGMSVPAWRCRNLRWHVTSIIALGNPGIEGLGVAEIFHISRGHRGSISHPHRINQAVPKCLRLPFHFWRMF